MIHFPYLLQRFRRQYPSTFGVEMVDAKSKLYSSNFVVSNSMSFYNDTCGLCTHTIGATNRLASYFQEQSRLMYNFQGPILLIHIPLFRPDDSETCEFPRSLKEKVKEKNIEGKDVLHLKASEFILKQLRPRLVLSGHTHMNCKTQHTLATESDGSFTTEELTLTSYNHKYAEYKPGFMLLSVNSTHTYNVTCNLVEEWVIASIYLATAILFCAQLLISIRRLQLNINHVPLR